jgi:hypothetical protein
MKNGRFLNHLSVALLLGCGLLGAVLFLQLRDGRTTRTGGAATPSRPVAPAPELAQERFLAPEKGAFAEILERPLFTAGREPPPAPVAPVAPPPPSEPLPLQLEGVAITPDTRVAIFRDLRSNEALNLAEGTEHQGWRIERVDARSATLKRGEQSQKLTLEAGQHPGRTRRR